jgi:hypothetical protein
LTPATTRPAGESVYTRGDWAAATRERCALAECYISAQQGAGGASAKSATAFYLGSVLVSQLRRLPSSSQPPNTHPLRAARHPPLCCIKRSLPTSPAALLHTRGATPRDMRVLPKRIFLVRHAESEGNVDNSECRVGPVVTQRDDMEPPLCRHVSAQGRCLAGWLLADRARGCFAQHGAGFSPMPISSLLSSFCLCHWPQ